MTRSLRSRFRPYHQRQKMSETIENYTPQSIIAEQNRTSRTVWLVLLFLSAGWAGVIVAAPLLKQAGFVDLSNNLYWFFHYLCHQFSERSFHLGEDKLAVCARCFGVYAGLFLAFAFYPLFRRVNNIEPLPRLWLLLACVPIAIDWGLTFFGIWQNTHASRFFTGALLGGACAVYILPAAVEIVQKLTRQNKH